MFSTITEALKCTHGIRVSYGHRWLVHNKGNGRFEVYEHLPYQKISRGIEDTTSEKKALFALLSYQPETEAK